MSIRGILKKLGDIFLVKNEYVYRPKGGGPPIYIIGDGVYKIKPEDLYRTPNFKENMEALNEAFLKRMRTAEEKPAAEAGKTPGPAQKNSPRRPEGAD